MIFAQVTYSASRLRAIGIGYFFFSSRKKNTLIFYLRVMALRVIPFRGVCFDAFACDNV